MFYNSVYQQKILLKNNKSDLNFFFKIAYKHLYFKYKRNTNNLFLKHWKIFLLIQMSAIWLKAILISIILDA